MPVTTSDQQHAPVAKTFPRLMQHRSTGAVYLVYQRTPRPGGPPVSVNTVYDACCIHHASMTPHPNNWGAALPAPPPQKPDAIGEQIPEVNLGNFHDYPNIVSLQNDGS